MGFAAAAADHPKPVKPIPPTTLEAILARLRGPAREPVARVAALKGISPATLYLWRRKARQSGALCFLTMTRLPTAGPPARSALMTTPPTSPTPCGHGTSHGCLHRPRALLPPLCHSRSLQPEDRRRRGLGHGECRAFLHHPAARLPLRIHPAHASSARPARRQRQPP
jgi:hypothetical protein